MIATRIEVLKTTTNMLTAIGWFCLDPSIRSRNENEAPLEGGALGGASRLANEGPRERRPDG
jgi:hypothetical protein